MLDHVSVPASRSVSRKPVKREPPDDHDVLLLTDEEDPKGRVASASAPARGRSSLRASNVKAEPETDEEDMPLAKTSRGRAKGRAAPQPVMISDDDVDDDDDDDDFVLSEEEVKPVKSGARTPSRAAVLRAAESRRASSSKTALPTPQASGTSTPMADRVWVGSESEAEESDYVSDLTDEDSPPPKKKGKAKAKASGRRLDGGEGEELPAAWGKKKKTRREKDADDEEKKEIKKQERKRVAELGRKLTQGEKNQIRLQRVSSSQFTL